MYTMESVSSMKFHLQDNPVLYGETYNTLSYLKPLQVYKQLNLNIA